MIVSITITCVKEQPKHAQISIVLFIKRIRTDFKKSLISILVPLNLVPASLSQPFFHIHRRGETFRLLLEKALKQRMK